MTVPTDPFRLAKHLIEVHGVDEDLVDRLDSDELRDFHERLVSTRVKECE